MWKWKNKILEEIPKNKVGFIYIIENIKTKQFYIGKKQFFNSKTVKLSNKKQKIVYSGKGRKPVKEVIVKESNWRSYTSSSKELNRLLLNDKGNFTFKIIEFAETNYQLKYLEALHQFKHDVLRNKLSFNQQIIFRGSNKYGTL